MMSVVLYSPEFDEILLITEFDPENDSVSVQTNHDLNNRIDDFYNADWVFVGAL